MKTLFVIAILALSCSLVLGWDLPPSDGGMVTSPAMAPYESAGTINATTATGTTSYLTSRVQCTLTFGNWKVPSYRWFTPDPLSNSYETFWQGIANVYVKDAASYNFSVSGAGTTNEPTRGSWYNGGQNPPLFGMPQVTQKGDSHPYADGTVTCHQRACLAYSILAGGKRINRCPWDGNQFVDYLKLAKGFSVRDVKCPVAAHILGMTYIGELSYSTANVQKYMARGWLIVLKVAVYHWSQAKGAYWTTHFIALAPGVTLKTNEAVLSVMDPFLRTSYLPYSRYTVKAMKVFAPTIPIDSSSLWNIPYFWTKTSWWKKPYPTPPVWEPFQIAWHFPSGQTDPGSVGSIGLARIDATSSAGTFIESVYTPTYQLTAANSEEVSEYATLSGDFTGAEHNDDDPLAESTEPLVLPPDDHTIAGIGDAAGGGYIFHLSGKPGTAWTLTISPTDDFGNPMDDVTHSGVFDPSGEANVCYNFDPGTVIYQLGAMRQLAVGAAVMFSMEVTQSNTNEFYVETQDRSAGARVISTANPVVGSTVQAQGKIVRVSPEITIEATSITTGLTAPTIKPLGIPAKWPEMANCLLTKICGRVVSIKDTTVTITNGTTETVINGVDQLPTIGDFITAVGISRAGNVLELKAGSITVL